MTRLKKDGIAKSFVTTLKRPEPVTLVAEVNVTDDLCRAIQIGRDYAINMVKRQISQQLLDQIMAKCFPFDIDGGFDSFVNRRQPLRMEVTLHDRGAYEHWLPVERQKGWNEGFAGGEYATRRRLPHGIDIDRTED